MYRSTVVDVINLLLSYKNDDCTALSLGNQCSNRHMEQRQGPALSLVHKDKSKSQPLTNDDARIEGSRAPPLASPRGALFTGHPDMGTGRTTAWNPIPLVGKTHVTAGVWATQGSAGCLFRGYWASTKRSGHAPPGTEYTVAPSALDTSLFKRGAQPSLPRGRRAAPSLRSRAGLVVVAWSPELELKHKRTSSSLYSLLEIALRTTSPPSIGPEQRRCSAQPPILRHHCLRGRLLTVPQPPGRKASLIQRQESTSNNQRGMIHRRKPSRTSITTLSGEKISASRVSSRPIHLLSVRS